ncbi:MAG: protein kinase [Gemmatimonadetes bacterium]|nr:protein kinase [Gemmatimonadota bacterium]
MPDLLVDFQHALGDAYHVERELGVVGLSRVYLAADRAHNRHVVIKVLLPDVAHEVDAARFRHEIDRAAHVEHPNLLPVLTAGTAGEWLYFVVPHCAGESLRHRLTREGKLPVADAVRVLSEVADALASAHARGIVHRDVKPENILIDGGQVLLTDCGVAQALVRARRGDRPSEAGLELGAPGYMAPEQAAGDQPIDPRADVYALGVVGYEMLAGFPPFAGPTAEAIVSSRVTGRPQALRALRPETPPQVEEAIGRALANDPADRPRTALEFRDACGGSFRLPILRRRSKRARLGIVAGGMAVIAAAAILVARSRAVGSLDPDLVAVAPFEVLAPSLELWREGMMDVLSRDLDGAGPLRTVSPTVVVRRWRGRPEPAAAAELGRKTGARLALFGSVLAAGGDSVRVAAALVDAATRSVLTEIELREPEGRLDRAADSITVRLLRELGRTRPISAVRLTSLPSASLPALKAFLQGEQHFRRTNWDSAVVYYERAVALDSTFALALHRLGVTVGWQRTGADSLSQAYAFRAGALNHGLAPRESLLVLAESLSAALAGYSNVPDWWRHSGRFFATLEAAAHRYPDDPEVWYELGDARYHYGYWRGSGERQALDAFDRAIALDSAFAPAYIHPVELALTVHGPAAARRYAAAYVALGSKEAEGTGIPLVATLLDPAQARSAAVATLLDTVSADVLSNAWVALGRWPDSAEIGVRLARLILESRHGSARLLADSVGNRFGLAGALVYRGRLREAARLIDDQYRILFSELVAAGVVLPESATARYRRWLAGGQWAAASSALPWWANRGDTAAIQRLLRSIDAAERFSRFAVERTRAYLALARRDTSDALRRFAALPESLCAGCFIAPGQDRLTFARLLSAQRRDKEATGLLGFAPPGMTRLLSVATVLERARVAERLGERENAITAFRFVADVWRNADPELQPYVEEAKAALGRLRAEGR